METVAGVFKDRLEAEQAAEKLPSQGVSGDRIVLLSRGSADQTKVDKRGFITDGEQRGMGRAVGGTVGGALGAGTGFAGAALAATIPGIGPIFAIGMAGAATLGLLGAIVGEAAGNAYEQALAKGLPTDEWFVYQDALRQGRSIVLAQVDNDQAEPVRKSLAASGAESIDAAREQWWLGLRGAEKDHYLKTGKDFARVEQFYRRGFEAALKNRRKQQTEGQPQAAVLSLEIEKLHLQSPEMEESFRKGFERGWEHYETVAARKAA